ncbi:MAG TPA: DNA polymerase I [Candidatus Limnocylindrales bacterium]|nr:DNA polymerase I [Candidatus Limnocylindrales bacterium]
MQRLMLFDSNSLIYRAYFALMNTPLTTSKGKLVNAVFGFWSIVLRGFQDVKPDYVIAAFDLKGPTFRHEQFADYKATRREMPDDLKDQFPIVRELIEAFGIPIYQLQGFEADDLIAALVKQAEAQDVATTIVSGDLDLLQLVSERTTLMTTRGGVQQTTFYDPAKVMERYGLEPSQMIDFKALKGDTTDNIPGIAGVGEKTAAKLVQDYGSVDAIYERIDTVLPEKLRAKLVDNREDVFRWRDLVTVRADLPIELDLETARLGDYDRDEVLRLFREYEFRSLVERLPGITGEEARAPGDMLREADRLAPIPAVMVAGRQSAAERAQSAPSAGGGGMQLSLDFGASAAAGASTANGHAPLGEATDAVTTAVAQVEPPAAQLQTASQQGAREHLIALLRQPEMAERFDAAGDVKAWLAAQPDLTLGVALTDHRPRRGDLLGLAVVDHTGRIVAAGPNDAVAFADLVIASGKPLVGHELKQLLVWELSRRDPTGTGNVLREARNLPEVAFDSQIAAYILNAALRSQTLGSIASERLEIELPQDGLLGGADHAALQATAVAAAREPLERDLGSDAGLDKLLREIELPLIPVLATLEAAGVAIDRQALGQLSTAFSTEIARLEEEIYADVGHQFTIGSPKQLEQVLFYELNLPRGRRTKTGFSTEAAVLEDLRAAHPAIDKILEWRTYTKLRSTYVESLPLLLDAKTGRLHTTFHQAVASTGRLSSTDPNLQNIPIRSELGRKIRHTFVAGSPDVVLLAADYSQIELRILAHVSGDVHLRQAFEERADIHRETAARVLKKEPSDVTSDERSMAKMVNFGLAYGMSDFGLSSRANIPRAEAQEFISSYFAAYSGISYYMMHIKEVAREQGYVSTLFGRRRWIPELQARNGALRGAGERMAINMPIQGTAADIVKIAMIRLYRRLLAEDTRARMLLQVHDELLLEVPRDELDQLVPVVREEMENAVRLDVPLTVDLKSGDDWESLTPIPA